MIPASDIQTNWLYIAIPIGLQVYIPVFYKIQFISKNADTGSKMKKSLLSSDYTVVHDTKTSSN
jgi:hypothetical protein